MLERCVITVNQGSPTSRPQTSTGPGLLGMGPTAGVSLNGMHLNHPETIPPTLSMEDLSSMKLVLGAKKVV